MKLKDEITEVSQDDDGDISFTNQEGSLVDYVIKSDEPIQTMLPDEANPKGVIVSYSLLTQEYDIFRIGAVTATIRTDLYNKVPDRVYEMEMAETSEGDRKFTGTDIKRFKDQWCVNRCKAMKDNDWKSKDFAKMVEFINSIVFEGESLLLAKEMGILKTSIIKKSHRWESYKFRLSASVDSFANFRAKIAKLIGKKKKAELNKIEAMSKQVIYIQQHMKLKEGMYVTAGGFGLYFKEMHKAVFETDLPAIDPVSP